MSTESRANQPATKRLTSWLDLSTPGRITVRPGKVELGQGISTAFAQLAAEEFEVDLARIVVADPATGLSPDEGSTSGSRSIQESGESLKEACAEARRLLLQRAAEIYSCTVAELRVDEGTVIGPAGQAKSYWDLADTIDLTVDISGPSPQRRATGHRVVGRSIKRTDSVASVTGGIEYVHNMALPGMLHARVVRPPTRSSVLERLPTADLGPDSWLYRNGSFLAVVSTDEATTVAIASRIRDECSWSTTDDNGLPDESRLEDWLRQAPSSTHSVVDTVTTAREPTLRSVYTRPFISHASIGPSCAVARWGDEGLSLWCSSQDIYALRRALSRLLEVEIDKITVAFKRGSGCYGQNGADDVGFEAALLAMAHPGRPIRLQWSREEELGWESYGPAAVVELAASLDANGEILQWHSDAWSNGTGGRPGRAEEVFNFASVDLLEGFPTRKPSRASGIARNLVPEYRLGEIRVRGHHVLDNPIRTSSLRSLGAHVNVFANESFVDELAHHTGADPVDFRLSHLEDERARSVIEAAAARAGWGKSLADDCGLGIGYARYKGSAGYCSVVAEVEASHELLIRQLTIAVDVGLVVNPDGLESQIEGGAVQSASWTLIEQVRFSRRAIRSTNWESYPIIRFSEVPPVAVTIVGGDRNPSLGAGEISVGPTAAAIGNALYDAIGLRVRDLPLTAERIRRAADSRGELSG